MSVSASEMASLVADIVGDETIDGKAFRRFVRAMARANGVDTPGKGRRYAFNEGDADAMAAAFIEWRKAGTSVRIDASSLLGLTDEGEGDA